MERDTGREGNVWEGEHGGHRGEGRWGEGERERDWGVGRVRRGWGLGRARETGVDGEKKGEGEKDWVSRIET